MAKKKRYLQKEVKTVEVYRKPMLQEAWDVVCDHLAVEYRKGNLTWFVDAVGGGLGGYVKHGDVALRSADQNVLVVSSKNYNGAIWGEEYE